MAATTRHSLDHQPDGERNKCPCLLSHLRCTKHLHGTGIHVRNDATYQWNPMPESFKYPMPRMKILLHLTLLSLPFAVLRVSAQENYAHPHQYIETGLT